VKGSPKARQLHNKLKYACMRSSYQNIHGYNVPGPYMNVLPELVLALSVSSATSVDSSVGEKEKSCCWECCDLNGSDSGTARASVGC
jgi:hypothetical protein